jgi:hypothetical protein
MTAELMAAGQPKNPRRVAAGRVNGSKRRAWTTEDRQRLSRQCMERKPWLASTGPRTTEGKWRSAQNGRRHLPDPDSLRQFWLGLSDVYEMMYRMACLRMNIVIDDVS